MSHRFELDFDKLFPRVQRPGTEEVELILVPGQVAVGFVLDTPMGWRIVDKELLSQWGIGTTELLAPATENVRRLSAPHSWIPVATVPGIHVYHAADGMAAARMLVLDTILGTLPADGVIVTAPAPDQLLCVPLDGPAAIEALTVLLAATSVAAEASSEPLSDQAYWYDGTWLHTIEVHHTEDDVEAVLPPALKEALERLSVLFYAVAAEA